MLDIGGGGFLGIGDQHFLLPVESMTKVDDHNVRVGETGGRETNSPKYDPKRSSHRRVAISAHSATKLARCA